MTDPTFHVRFYIRTKQSKRGEELTPLRLRVWVSATKRYLYLSTGIKVTPWQWSAFTTEGTPTMVAEPKLAKRVDRYRTAVNMVLSAAIANNKIDSLTSEQFKMFVEGVVVRLDINEKTQNPRPILIFAEPQQVATCTGCIFASDECRAPWDMEYERQSAPDAAAFTGMCPKRVTNGNIYQPNPSRPPQRDMDDDLLHAAVVRYIKTLYLERKLEALLKQANVELKIYE